MIHYFPYRHCGKNGDPLQVIAFFMKMKNLVVLEMCIEINTRCRIYTDCDK